MAPLVLGDGMVEGAGHSENGTSLGSGLSPEGRRSFLGALLSMGGLFVGTLLSVPLIRFALFPLLRRTTDLKKAPVGELNEFSSLAEPILRTIQIEQVNGGRKAISNKAAYVPKNSHAHLLVLPSTHPPLHSTA